VMEAIEFVLEVGFIMIGLLVLGDATGWWP
jgi:hypothetical protein